MGGKIEIIPEKLIASQQLRLRLRNSQVRENSKVLRVSEAFSNHANVTNFSEIGRGPVLNVDKVLFQRYIVAHRQNEPFFLKIIREFVTSILKKLPGQTAGSIIRNKYAIWLWNRMM